MEFGIQLAVLIVIQSIAVQAPVLHRALLRFAIGAREGVHVQAWRVLLSVIAILAREGLDNEKAGLYFEVFVAEEVVRQNHHVPLCCQ